MTSVLSSEGDLNETNHQVSSESDCSNTPPDSEHAEEVTVDLLPRNSRLIYEKKYEQFMSWCSAKGFNKISESVLMEYFLELSKVLKSPTLWSIYSMLKATIQMKNDIRIESYKKLTAFLKRKAVGSVSKKSKALTRDQVIKFVLEAPDKEYLMKKVTLIFGIAGACRRDELVKMTIDNVDDKGSIIIVNISDSKSKKNRVFTITNNNEDGVDYLSICRKYFKLRPKAASTNRLFLRYSNGVCTNQVVGMNSIAKIPKEIAEFLNLPNPDIYTGHCFRRTSTALVSGEGDIAQLKHGDWRSSTVAEGNIEELNQIVTAQRTLDTTISAALFRSKNQFSSLISARAEGLLRVGVPPGTTGPSTSVSKQLNKGPGTASLEQSPTVIKEEVDVPEEEYTSYSPETISGDVHNMECEVTFSDGEATDPLELDQQPESSQNNKTKASTSDEQILSSNHSPGMSDILKVADALSVDIQNILSDEITKLGDINPNPTTRLRKSASQPSTKTAPTLNFLKTKYSELEETLRILYLKTMLKKEEELLDLKIKLQKLQIMREETEEKNSRQTHLLRVENLQLENAMLKAQLQRNCNCKCSC